MAYYLPLFCFMYLAFNLIKQIYKRDVSVVRVHNTGGERKLCKCAVKILSSKVVSFIGLKQLRLPGDFKQKSAANGIETTNENKIGEAISTMETYIENTETKRRYGKANVVDEINQDVLSVEWIYLARFLDRIFFIIHITVWCYHTFFTG